MKLTPYNNGEALEYLRAKTFIFLMSGEIDGCGGPLRDELFELVSDMTIEGAAEAIRSFEATQ